MGKALYRTYRSKTLSELVGQEHVTTALSRSLEKGTIGHAYLFTGPRGVGKTSIARILAHEINKIPYTDDSMHLDIIEIDAASNRRIDEIRDLRDKVHLAPTSAKYKVYIIDEVHMLTKEAFNALLKTLEEPPEHVVFILATTEAHKLPETIISRTQRFAFKPVDLEAVAKHLRSIAEKEKITISDDALGLVAAHGEGSFRDSISLLDQIRNTAAKVELSDVQSMLGIAPDELVRDLEQALAHHDLTAVTSKLLQLYEQGFEPAQLAKQLGTILREHLIEGVSVLPPAQVIGILEKLLKVPGASDPKTSLQIVLLDAALDSSVEYHPPAPAAKPAAKVMPAPVAAPAPVIETRPVHPAKKVEPVVELKPVIATPPPQEEEPKPDVPKPATNSSGSNAVLNEDSWQLVLGALKQKHNALHTVVKMARTAFEPGEVKLGFRHAFHQKRCNTKDNKQILIDTIAETTGDYLNITIVVDANIPEPLPKPPMPPEGDEVVHNVSAAPQPENKDLTAISSIFGAAEVLES